MKTKFLLLIVAVCAIISTSCSKDDVKKEEPKVFEKLTVDISGEFSQDLLDVANIQAVYKDETGKTVTEDIKLKEWSKKLIFTKLPASIEVYFKVLDKKSVLTKEKYVIKQYTGLICMADYTNNKNVYVRPNDPNYSLGGGNISDTPKTVSELAAFLSLYGGNSDLRVWCFDFKLNSAGDVDMIGVKK